VCVLITSKKKTASITPLIAIAWLLLPAGVLFALAGGSAFAAAGDTVARVKAREVVRCGVSEGIAGFSRRDVSGRWPGLDADFCRARRGLEDADLPWGAILCMMQGFTKTGLLQGLSLKLHGWFGTDYTLVALAILAGVGVLSSVLANIPVVAASVVMIKGYLVAAEAVPELALSGDFTDWPAAVLPVFIAMMFAGTLGGNATMIGASANIVSVGICARQGERVTFVRFLRYGLPITLAQLAVGALYVLALLWLAS
jgi:hypothetical protein